MWEENQFAFEWFKKKEKTKIGRNRWDIGWIEFFDMKFELRIDDRSRVVNLLFRSDFWFFNSDDEFCPIWTILIYNDAHPHSRWLHTYGWITCLSSRELHNQRWIKDFETLRQIAFGGTKNRPPDPSNSLWQFATAAHSFIKKHITAPVAPGFAWCSRPIQPGCSLIRSHVNYTRLWDWHWKATTRSRKNGDNQHGWVVLGIEQH